MLHRIVRFGSLVLGLWLACGLHAQTGTSVLPDNNVLPAPKPPGTAAATTPPSLFGISGGGSVELGQKVTLVVNVSTPIDPELTYQWRRNGADLAGATAGTYVIDAVTPADSATYTVAVSNSAGTSVATTDVTVKAAAAPVITTQPRTVTASVGQTITFTFVATGSFPRTYQWRKDGNNLAGGTDAILTLTAITTAGAGAYSVVITNALGTVTSSPASLTVNAATPPVISTSYPFDVSATQGSTATLSSSLSAGSSPFTYQWMKNGAAIAGATNASLAFTAVAVADAGKYSFTVTNIAGTATSREATLTVNPPTPITIFSHPQSQTLFQGQPLNLSVSWNGSSPITYQWQKNGTNLSGATSSSFSISSLALADAGSYTVVMTNAAGPVTSNAATITVNPATPPVFTSQPAATLNVAFNNSFSLNVQVSGAPPFTFAWKKDGVALTSGTSSGSTSSSYSFSSSTPAQNGTYTVTVTNAAGSTVSTPTVVTVTPALAPTISSQPAARAVAAGLSASFSVNYSTTGTGQITAQWLKNGVPIPGATSSSYSISAVKESDAGDYAVVLTGPGGAVTSNKATLTVLPVAPPVVGTWPSDRSPYLGESASFNVYSVEGSGPFTYQWFKAGTLLPGVTGSSLNIPIVNENDLGTYMVVVSNEGGLTASPPFTLSISTSTSSTVTAPWIAAAQLGNVVYFLAKTPARILRYDLATDAWLPTVFLSETQVPSAFLPLAEGVYVAYGRSLVRRSPDLVSETAVVNSTVDITQMVAVDDFLYYNSASGSGSGSSQAVGSVRRSTLAAGPLNTGSLPQAVAGPRTRRIFSTDGSSSTGYPRGMTVGSDGRLTSITPSVSSYYTYPTTGPLFVFPAEDYIANGAGTLFRTSDFAYAGSVGPGLNDLAFFSDGTPLALRSRAIQTLGGPGLLEVGRVDVPFIGLRVFVTEQAAVVFGAPQTTGGSPRTVKIPRSSFVPISLPVVPAPEYERFTVDAVFAGADGVVGIFSRSKQALLRWSPASRSYLSSVPLRGQPQYLSQTSSTNRVLFSYADGIITEVPLRSTATKETQIGTVGNRPWALTDLGDLAMVNLRSYSSSGDFRVVLGAQGQTVYVNSNSSYYAAGADWLPAQRRLYSYDRFSTVTLGFETVSATGVLSNSTGSSSSTTVPVTAPLRFNPEGTLLATGNGRVYNADLAQVGTLANNISDAAWLSRGLFTLRTGLNGNAEVQRWDRITYLQSGTLAIGGTPLRILRLSDTQLLVISSVQGFMSYTVVNAELEVIVPPGGADLAGVYTGTLGTGSGQGAFSLYVRPDRTGVLLVQLATTPGALLSTTVVVGTDGSFVTTGRALDDTGGRAVAGVISPAGVLSGTIPSLNLSLRGTKTAGTAASAGFYSASALNGTTGGAYAIVGADGAALLVAQASTVIGGGGGTVGADGRFTVTTPTGAKISATLNAGAGSLTATGDSGSLAGASFAGLRDGLERTDRLANISTRGRAGAGDDLMIAGFVLTGNASRPVLIRAIGPTLGGFGVPGTLADPRLELYRGSTKVAENDNWSTANDLVATTARVGGFALPAASADAALLVTLEPGAYSAQISGAGTAAGNALVEVYDAGAAVAPGAVSPRLINISTRGRLASADDNLIAGIVVTGNAPKRLLIRAVGPGLTAFGVTGALADPVLTLTTAGASGTVTVATNDDWSQPASGAATAFQVAAASVSAGAFPLTSNSKDACLLLTLQPGTYTAQVIGKNGGIGAALVEVYEINN